MTLFITVDCAIIGDFGRCDKYAPCMFTNATGNPFEPYRHFPNLIGIFIIHIVRIVKQIFELRFGFNRVSQRNTWGFRDKFGDFISKTVRFTLNACDITHHRFCRHRTKGDDLGYRFSSIFLRHIINNAVAPFDTKIDVKVWHGYPLRVQKPFKQ